MVENTSMALTCSLPALDIEEKKWEPVMQISANAALADETVCREQCDNFG